MNLIPTNPSATMSSREIAELTGSTHDNVLKTIRGLVGKGVVFGNETPYRHPQNGQIYGEFLLSFRDTMVVVSGYSAEMRARIIDRWQELEKQVAAPADPLMLLNDPVHLRSLLLGYDEKVIALQSTVDHQAPKVAALDRFATETAGSYSLREAAKSLQLKPKKFVTWLVERRWIYRHPDGGRWLAFQPRLDSGMLEHKVVTGQRNDGTDWGTTQVRVTAKGLARIAELLEGNQGGKAA